MTKNLLPLTLASALLLLLSIAAVAAPQTMRLDYYHTGNSKQEVFSLDHIVIEPLPWPGDMDKSIDDTNLGKYFFEVRDQKTKKGSLLARLCLHLRRVGNDRRSHRHNAHV